MSFLVDDPSVVEEAIAFIDSCESEGSSTGSGVDNSDENIVSAEKLSGDPQTKARPGQAKTQPNAKPKKRRVKTFASSSTRQLQRKKAEMTSLREQLIVLQAQKAWLLRSKYATSTETGQFKALENKDSKKSEWHDQAVGQFVKRQQSENTNRELKTIFANQEKMIESLRSVLGKRSLLDDMNFVFKSMPSPHGPFASLDKSSGVMSQLEKRVESLYIDSDTALSGDQPWLVSSRMHVNNNTQYGKVIEIETVTPVACSIHEATAILWQDTKTIHEIPDKRYRYLRGQKPNSLEKNFVMKLRGKESDLVIDGSHFSRKFEETKRIVIAKADTIVLSTEGIQFRSPSWTVVTASESDPQHLSIVRSYVRIYSEVQPNLKSDAKAEDIESARNFVLNGLSKMMFGCAQKTQNVLIQQAMVI
ncbi:hypothetical protein PHYBOEH_006635 [Phytophthora boehmeriae]|uniref:M96 mating-specific protein family n=1 Tax=Phytophthora boehmeriae TaxID=109152 RepID=A0A8T1WC69_9STRA|nr:hypothetical protein PHYBOEH_006635 [Phytophthora boehmeriae]